MVSSGIVVIFEKSGTIVLSCELVVALPEDGPEVFVALLFDHAQGDERTGDVVREPGTGICNGPVFGESP